MIRSIVFVATPNSGTPLCDGAHLGDLLDVVTNLAAVVPDHPVTDTLEIVLELMKDIALDIALDALPGLTAMDPNGPYLAALNRRVLDPGITLRAIAADFEPMTSASKVVRLRDRVFDRVFGGGMNDLVVPTRSAYLRSADFAVAADQRLVLDSSHGVNHASYWEHVDVLDQLEQWLRPDWPVNAPSPAAAARADANADIETALAHADGGGLVDALQRFDTLAEGFKQLVWQVTSGPVSSPTRRHRRARRRGAPARDHGVPPRRAARARLDLTAAPQPGRVPRPRSRRRSGGHRRERAPRGVRITRRPPRARVERPPRSVRLAERHRGVSGEPRRVHPEPDLRRPERAPGPPRRPLDGRARRPCVRDEPPRHLGTDRRRWSRRRRPARHAGHAQPRLGTRSRSCSQARTSPSKGWPRST